MKITCLKCNEVMKKTRLDKYEYVEGTPLFDVPGYQCPRCGEFFFTEDIVDTMEERTAEIRRHEFGFKRRLTTSGGGLVVRVPPDLAQDLKLREGQQVRLLPIKHRGFVVEKA